MTQDRAYLEAFVADLNRLQAEYRVEVIPCDCGNSHIEIRHDPHRCELALIRCPMSKTEDEPEGEARWTLD